MVANASAERRRAENEARARGRLALLGFLAHAPGLYVLAGRTLAAPWLRLNLIAAAATAIAMVLAGAALRDRGQMGLGIAGAWVVGHTAWSLGLAWGVLKGKALKDRRAAPRDQAR